MNDNIIWCMCIACWITKATERHSCNTYCFSMVTVVAQTSQCSVICTLPILNNSAFICWQTHSKVQKCHINCTSDNEQYLMLIFVHLPFLLWLPPKLQWLLMTQLYFGHITASLTILSPISGNLVIWHEEEPIGTELHKAGKTLMGL